MVVYYIVQKEAEFWAGHHLILIVCSGCKNCANVAPDVFGIEEDFGRARVCNQAGNPALVQQAIDSW